MALLFNKEYDKALPLIRSLKLEDKKFYLIAYHLFQGWYILEKNGDAEASLKHFDIVELMIQNDKTITKDIYNLTCYKKAQIYSSKGMNDEAKSYYKKALSGSAFEEIQDSYKEFQKRK